ncbi:type 4b pilus protein PilO2 [Crenobacter sp. SG2305]|uniref:type 4b pilus protein PilO2 n=1 Tax=Crenobacter oryzisoli TaxID=3056844 RepID=UPI0025AA602C|nr:type 4b pilus protein PilO2 [Crenobacter sp. SG2305]MDN0082478.1 type 4b pilus protein PilO2 [Crenobacter sp. SG2305]
MSDVRVFDMGKGRRYAVGLTWQVEKAPSSKERAAALKSKTATMLKLPAGDRPTHRSVKAVGEYQVTGFGRFPKNQKAVAPLMCLMDLRADFNNVSTWAAILKIEPDLYWFGASLNGMTVPGSDMVGSKELILEKWADHANLFQDGESPVYVCPEDEDMTGVSVIDLAEWLGDIPKKKWDAQSIKPIEGWATPKNLALLAIIVAAGGWLFQDWWHERQLKEEFAQIQAKAQSQQSPKNQQPIDLTPWSKHPSVAVFVNACLTVRNQLSLSVPGWNAQEASCEEGVLRITFVRDDQAKGFGVNDLISAFPNVTLMPGGKRAMLSIPLPMQIANDQGERALSEQALIREVHGKLDQYGLDSVDLAPQSNQAPGAPKSYKFTAKGNTLAVQEMGDLMSGMPTLRMSRVSVINTNNIDLEGVAYAQ